MLFEIDCMIEYVTGLFYVCVDACVSMVVVIGDI